MLFSKLTILGPGLLGASLAAAAKARGLAGEVAVWARREEAVAELLRRDFAHSATTKLEMAVADAELVILATPIDIMPKLSREMLPFLSPFVIVTDVGSVKGDLVGELENVLGGAARFVGSHPMAGGDQTGMEFATPTLFEKAACFVTPSPESDAAAVNQVSDFWKAVGCNVSEVSPDEHDRLVAAISHLPHLTAAMLSRAALNLGGEKVFSFAGPGFRDCTRVALGSPEMWTGIISANQKEILLSLSALRRELDEAERLVSGSREALTSWLDSAKTARTLA